MSYALCLPRHETDDNHTRDDYGDQDEEGGHQLLPDQKSLKEQLG